MAHRLLLIAQNLQVESWRTAGSAAQQRWLLPLPSASPLLCCTWLVGPTVVPLRSSRAGFCRAGVAHRRAQAAAAATFEHKNRTGAQSAAAPRRKCTESTGRQKPMSHTQGLARAASAATSDTSRCLPACVIRVGSIHSQHRIKSAAQSQGYLRMRSQNSCGGAKRHRVERVSWYGALGTAGCCPHPMHPVSAARCPCAAQLGQRMRRAAAAARCRCSAAASCRCSPTLKSILPSWQGQGQAGATARLFESASAIQRRRPA